MLAQCEAAGVFAATKTQEVRGRLPWGRLPWGRLNREFLGGGGVTPRAYGGPWSRTRGRGRNLTMACLRSTIQDSNIQDSTVEDSTD